MESCERREGFVGVHIGAGQHSEARTTLYLEICAAACQAAVAVLRNGGSALDAAEHATQVLEDAGETNAGYGSNLTESGTVEMDAGIMDGKSLLFGAVGAVSGIRNPIVVARKLVDEQKNGLLPLGRVPPGFLVGNGAREWAERHGIESEKPENLISDKAAKLYKHYKKKLDAYRQAVEEKVKRKLEIEGEEVAQSLQDCKKFRLLSLPTSDHVRSSDGASKHLDGHSSETEESPRTSLSPSCSSSRRRLSASNVTGASSFREGSSSHPTVHTHASEAWRQEACCEDMEAADPVQDTVGVVVLDRLGNVASSVSSGGIALKQPGRVGQASCFGCGCWAQRPVAVGTSSVAVSTTGCGEHLTRTFLARECGQGLAHTTTPMLTLQHIMKEKFVESPFLSGLPEKLGGAICMQYNRERGEGHFLWTHTTASMGIGFQSTGEAGATCRMSRLPKSPAAQGTTILVESVRFEDTIHHKESL